MNKIVSNFSSEKYWQNLSLISSVAKKILRIHVGQEVQWKLQTACLISLSDFTPFVSKLIKWISFPKRNKQDINVVITEHLKKPRLQKHKFKQEQSFARTTRYIEPETAIFMLNFLSYDKVVFLLRQLLTLGV